MPWAWFHGADETLNGLVVWDQSTSVIHSLSSDFTTWVKLRDFNVRSCTETAQCTDVMIWHMIPYVHQHQWYQYIAIAIHISMIVRLSLVIIILSFIYIYGPEIQRSKCIFYKQNLQTEFHHFLISQIRNCKYFHHRQTTVMSSINYPAGDRVKHGACGTEMCHICKNHTNTVLDIPHSKHKSKHTFMWLKCVTEAQMSAHIIIFCTALSLDIKDMEIYQ